MKIITILLMLSSPVFAIEKEQELVNAVQSTEHANGSYWLEQQSLMAPDEWDKVMLIFGWMDDETNCEYTRYLFAEVVNPNINWRCSPVKK